MKLLKDDFLFVSKKSDFQNYNIEHAIWNCIWNQMTFFVFLVINVKKKNSLSKDMQTVSEIYIFLKMIVISNLIVNMAIYQHTSYKSFNLYDRFWNYWKKIFLFVFRRCLNCKNTPIFLDESKLVFCWQIRKVQRNI